MPAMVDPIQRTSALPLPDFQTNQGTHNPVPLEAPREQQRLTDQVRGNDKDNSSRNFEDYLNRSSITTLEKAHQGKPYDPVDEITSASVYSQPGDKTGI
jgi:hypothetical protein